jgi:glycolate oxidase FAD binding subunit
LRDQTLDYFRPAIDADAALWRLSVRSTADWTEWPGDVLIEWGGAVRWLNAASALDTTKMREWSQEHGGHATLFRSASRHAGVFHPLSAPVMAIHQRLKSTFDPSGILNRGRMYADF